MNLWAEPIWLNRIEFCTANTDFKIPFLNYNSLNPLVSDGNIKSLQHKDAKKQGLKKILILWPK